MRPPEFWHRPPGGIVPALLAPCGLAYSTAALLRERAATPWRAPVPVVCVGNLTVGGAGKTPTALAVAARLQTWDLHVAFLSRGYGGTLRGPVLVDAARHRASEVGDEPLLLAARAQTWVARNRKDGARLAIADGADVIVMDDGLQNPTVRKDLRLVVVDADYGFGNEHVLPAGPLREPLARGLARADAFVLVGADKRGLAAMLRRHAPVLHAAFVPDDAARTLAGRKVHAFAGIGRPDKFFATLDALGALRAVAHRFADHHPYTEDEATRLIDAARRDSAIPVTTAKDYVRLPVGARDKVTAVSGDLVFNDGAALERLLRAAVTRTRDAVPDRTHG
jgi:tetraacyldisaccharide 4'-kinase